MDFGGLYRHGIASSITRQKGASATGFYGPSVSSSGSSIDGEQFNGHVPPGEREVKVNQMMGILSGTQQLMLVSCLCNRQLPYV